MTRKVTCHPEKKTLRIKGGTNFKIDYFAG